MINVKCACVCVCVNLPPLAVEKAKNSSFNTGMALQKKKANKNNQLAFLPFTECRTQATVEGSLVIGFTVPSTATLSSSNADGGKPLLFLRIWLFSSTKATTLVSEREARNWSVGTEILHLIKTAPLDPTAEDDKTRPHTDTFK